MTQALIVIPARMGSTRFPNKPTCRILGYTMIERVYKIAKHVKNASKVIIATDDELLANHVKAFGAEVVMTSSSCQTGTDRVADALHQLTENYDIVFNLQGDAVLTPPHVIEKTLDAMLNDSDIMMATPAVKLEGSALVEFIRKKREGSSSGTCVTFDKNGKALYFSKTLIPHHRDKLLPLEAYKLHQHIGLYAYKTNTLLQLTQLSQTPLEKIEQLEQLRALENGIAIQVVLVNYEGRTHGSVDNPEDVALVENIIQQEGELVIQ